MGKGSGTTRGDRRNARRERLRVRGPVVARRDRPDLYFYSRCGCGYLHGRFSSEVGRLRGCSRAALSGKRDA